MSSVTTHTKCQRCEYKEAAMELNCRNFSEYIQCYRCGYVEDRSINSEKSKFPEMIFWETQIINGKGSYIYVPKSGVGSYCGSVIEGSISAMKKELDKFRICKYTFQEDGKWYIKDLLSGEVAPFSTDIYWDDDQRKNEKKGNKSTQITIEENDFDAGW